MTREEIIQGLYRGDSKAIKEAIKELEQQPCEDTISRQAVLDKIKEVCFSKEKKWVDFRTSYGSHGQRDLIINFIEDSPSVTPKPKTDVLDKIRAEIADLADSDAYGDYQQGFNFGLMRAVQVIDKYKTEREGKE